MKSLKKTLYNGILAVAAMTLTVGCEDLALGENFLQKPPSTDVTIDTIFGKAEYAQRVLWKSYQYLPYGMETPGFWTQMCMSTIEGLTDINYDNIGWSALSNTYYPGLYNAAVENDTRKNSNRTKMQFSQSGFWTGVRHAWLFVQNVDRVPDMDAAEKSRLTAEAKMMVAVFYAHMLRHYGALPIIDHALSAEDDKFPARATLQETVDFIVKLLDEAIACKEFPWNIDESERDNWDGRMTKAGAMALKTRVLLFVASPLFNDAKPFAEGEASDKKMTWFGGYDKARWKQAADACKDFFDALNANGYYKLVEAGDNGISDERNAYTSAYFDRGNTETLIACRRQYLATKNNSQFDKALRWGAYCPTKEFFDMFEMKDGRKFDWNNAEMKKNPFKNRDPRLYENIILDGDRYNGRKADMVDQNPKDKANYPKGKDWKQGRMHQLSLATGLACRKWGLDRNNEAYSRPVQWPIMRMAEVYLNYAEALNEYHDGPTPEAYKYINAVRARVGMPGLKSGMTKQEFREAVLHERAVEFAYEEVRFFDLIRWKKYDVFETPLHGLHVYRHKKTKAYLIEPFKLTKYSRVWWKSGWEPRMCLSAFPSKEVNKGYGLVQNPGW
ncbi:RagB/SusD family nutrient uptake outer membrane protein [Hallella bergensis]|nr:RagB/SusD family nutrient uptake outer membrane protein [Hallella bergensis]